MERKRRKQRRQQWLGTSALFAAALGGVALLIWALQQEGACTAIGVSDQVNIDMSPVVGSFPAGGTFNADICVDGDCVRREFLPGKDPQLSELARMDVDFGPAGSLHQVRVTVTHQGRSIFSASTTAPSVERVLGEDNCAQTYFTITLKASGTGAAAELIVVDPT